MCNFFAHCSQKPSLVSVVKTTGRCGRFGCRKLSVGAISCKEAVIVAGVDAAVMVSSRSISQPRLGSKSTHDGPAGWWCC